MIGKGKWYEIEKHEFAGLQAVFLPFQPNEVLAESLSAASVHVVTLKKKLAGLLVPSKIYGVMAASRPVIFVGPTECTVAQIVQEGDCGYVVEPGDVDSFVKAVEDLYHDPGHREAMGIRARREFEEKYERKIATSKIGELLKSL
jgi:glycosyltransferase involved in cell wall biosynthesis